MSHIISSYLLDRPERGDPEKLEENKGLSFQGSIILGTGFTLTPDERNELIKRNKKNAERVFPYIGGKEVNTSPTQEFHRYVINFGAMSLDEAAGWPDLLDIVRERVKPIRDRLTGQSSVTRYRRERWWLFAGAAPNLRAAIDDLPRCLVTAQVSKHLCFSFQPTDRVFSHKLYVFPLPAFTHFSILQSRIHSPWAWMLSSTMRDAGISYAASDCFDTFPFPDADPRTIISPVESAGRKLYEARSEYMISANQGLTKTYNALKDPTCTDHAIIKLRRLHEVMDRVVLDAYGWSDIQVPDYAKKNEAFENEIIDRLYSLNKLRYDEKINSA